MSEEYVRKDLHDEQLEHIKDAFYIAVQDMNGRIDDLKTTINYLLAVMGIFLAAIGIALPVVLYYLTAKSH